MMSYTVILLNNRLTAVFTYSGGGDNDGCIKALTKILPNMKRNVALVDSKSKFASTNDAKLDEFIKFFD